MSDQHAITKTHRAAIDGRRGALTPQNHQPLPIVQHHIQPSQYETAKSRGLPPQQVPLPRLPSILTLTLSAVIAISFLVAASMFSIGLTAYSNSVDRANNQPRPYIRVE